MGIKGLTSFVRENFTRWQAPSAFPQHVVIDGNSICIELYKKNYIVYCGGEYKGFSCLVEQFFKVFQTRFNDPTVHVIFDGPHYSDKKLDTHLDRRRQILKEMDDWQRGVELVAKENTTTIQPVFLISVFMDILQQLKIKYLTANGDADNMVAALANYYECPVLSSDSDFFLFRLKHGLIYFERYYDEETSSNSLFNIDEFMKQFSLQDYELCLLLPALFGNDFITEHIVDDWCNEEHLKKIAGYKTSQEYLVKESDIVCGRTLRENFELAKKFYSDMKLPSDFSDEYVLMKDSCVNAMPDWVFKANFPSHLLSVHHKKTYLLPRVVEVIEMGSAWKLSRYIRRFLYGYIGIPCDAKVKEVIRKCQYPELEDKFIKPKFHLGGQINLSNPIFLNREVEKLKQLVLSVLQCYKMSESDIERISNLPIKWKLPIAATFYWYRHLDIPLAQRRDFVKSLLLIFLECFPDQLSLDRMSREPEHLTALHAFGQWQCVYYDAMALNYVAREPFPATSPASLYSGQAVMSLATKKNIREGAVCTLAKNPEKWKLFDTFLYLVTGLRENGEKGKHIPRSWTEVQPK